jgi:hypothetical protein
VGVEVNGGGCVRASYMSRNARESRDDLGMAQSRRMLGHLGMVIDISRVTTNF